MTPWLSLAISILLFVSEPNSHIEAKWHHKLVQLSFPHLPPTVMLHYAPPPPPPTPHQTDCPDCPLFGSQAEELWWGINNHCVGELFCWWEHRIHKDGKHTHAQMSYLGSYRWGRNICPGNVCPAGIFLSAIKTQMFTKQERLWLNKLGPEVGCQITT